LFEPGIGAEHSYDFDVYRYEWLGVSADDNPNEDEALPMDKYDDGVTIKWMTENSATFTVSVSSIGPANRYATAPMYLNAWVDWINDGSWAQGGDKIINGKTFTESKTQDYPQTVPQGVDNQKIGWGRFRLDWGENVGNNPQSWINPSLNQYQGQAAFGEVEDYKINGPPKAEAKPKTTKIRIPKPEEGRNWGTFNIKITNPTDQDIKVSMHDFTWVENTPEDTIWFLLTGFLDIPKRGTQNVNLPAFSVGSAAEPGTFPCEITWRVEETSPADGPIRVKVGFEFKTDYPTLILTPPWEKWQEFGAMIPELNVRLYSNEIAEWNALEFGEVDMTDCPLSKEYYDMFTQPPLNETIDTIGYGPEYGLNIIDINNNNNLFLGNPLNPEYPNPVYPNPASVKEMRQAIAHLVNRTVLDEIIGAGFYHPLYTPVPPYMGMYPHPEIRPGGTLESLTYPCSRVEAEAKLEAGFFLIGPDGWRYWDRNKNGVKDAGEELELKFFIRSDDISMLEFGLRLANELEATKVKVNRILGTISNARAQVMGAKDFHLYTGYWRLGIDPDFLYNWNSELYWHPGQPPNYACANDTNLNYYTQELRFANTESEVLSNAWSSQEAYAEKALSIPLWSYSGYKAMLTYYQEVIAWDPVNIQGYGVDNSYSFLVIHPEGVERGENITVKWGFKTQDIRSFNPLYAEEYMVWEWKIFGLIYDTLLKRDPYNLQDFMPWLAKDFEVGTYNHSIYGTSTKIKFSLRPEATWTDGTSVTASDVFFTFVELDDMLKAKGLPPPSWIKNVKNILSFEILDPYNFEVLFNGTSRWALSWIGEQTILPRHVWKPIIETSDPTAFAPDPNMIGSGPWRFKEYVPGSHIQLVANAPGSTVQTSHSGSSPIISPKGYWRWTPMIAETTIDGDIMARVSYGTSHTIDITITNLCLRGNTTIDSYCRITYSNGTIVEKAYTDVVLGAGSSWSFDHTDTLQGKIIIDLRVFARSPQELSGWLNFTDIIWATIPEDVCGTLFYDTPAPDIKVDGKDIATVAKAFNTKPGDMKWSTVADVSCDYKIDGKDVARLAKMFGWHG
jgi:ABC-type transport system substrate-binding protein